jgi:hypothetical protein
MCFASHELFLVKRLEASEMERILWPLKQLRKTCQSLTWPFFASLLHTEGAFVICSPHGWQLWLSSQSSIEGHILPFWERLRKQPCFYLFSFSHQALSISGFSGVSPVEGCPCCQGGLLIGRSMCLHHSPATQTDSLLFAYSLFYFNIETNKMTYCLLTTCIHIPAPKSICCKCERLWS